MAKRAKLNRTDAENIAIRAQVDAYIAQGLPLDQAQAVAFKDFAAGQIRVQSSPRPARGATPAAAAAALLAAQMRKRKASRQRAIEADISAGRRYKSGRKKSTKKKGR